jgi:hypothetical protein
MIRASWGREIAWGKTVDGAGKLSTSRERVLQANFSPDKGDGRRLIARYDPVRGSHPEFPDPSMPNAMSNAILPRTTAVTWI